MTCISLASKYNLFKIQTISSLQEDWKMGGMFAILSVLSREFWATQAKRKVVEINTEEWNQFLLLRNDST